jgi:hypothetical protein
MAPAGNRAGPLPRPGPIGRSVRLLLGVAILYFFAGIVWDLAELVDGVNLANPLTQSILSSNAIAASLLPGNDVR